MINRFGILTRRGHPNQADVLTVTTRGTTRRVGFMTLTMPLTQEMTHLINIFNHLSVSTTNQTHANTRQAPSTPLRAQVMTDRGITPTDTDRLLTALFKVLGNSLKLTRTLRHSTGTISGQLDRITRCIRTRTFATS